MSDNPFFRFADVTGDGSGSTDGAVNGAVTAVTLKLKRRAGDPSTLNLTRMIVNLQDTGAFDASKYGNDIDMANGILVKVYKSADDSVVLDCLDGVPIKTNGHWARQCHDVSVFSWGTGDEVGSVRWTFSKAGKTLKIQDDEYLGITIQDDLSGLNAHTFQLQGY